MISPLLTDVLPQDLVPTIFAEEIKCRCDGLPLAAKTLAEVLAKTAWEAGSLATGYNIHPYFN